MLTLAENHARRLGHGPVEPEHVLLGLSEEGQGVAAHVFQCLGADFDCLQREVERLAPPRPTDAGKPIMLSDAAGRLLISAIEELGPLGHQYIGTEHLALAISRVSSGVIPAVLVALGVSPAAIRRETYGLLGHLELAAREAE